MSSATVTHVERREGEVLTALAAARIVPVATFDDADHAEAVGRTLVAAGLPCLEVALRTSAAAAALRAARGVPGLLLGAGTVLDPAQAELAAELGADFAVSPGLDEAVAAACRDLGLPLVPGAATATEAARARRLGFRAIKLFPAAPLGGPAFVRALAEASAGLRFLPTGGIGPDDVADYLAIPSVLAVGGSWLVPRERLLDGGVEEVRRLAEAAVAIVRRVDAGAASQRAR